MSVSKKEREPSIRFTPISKNTKAELGEFVVAQGIIDVEKRYTTIPTETIVGVFDGGDSVQNIANVERALERLNGCKVRVKIQVLEIPKEVLK